ncbi:MAG: response regulator [Pseudomonadota bacterium]
MSRPAYSAGQERVSEQQRARYFVLTAAVALTALIWGISLAVYNGYPEFAWFFVFPIAVSVLSPLYVRRSGRALLAEHLLLISTLSCVLGLGLYTGGRATGTLFFSVFIPALAAVMTGWRTGALYGLVSFVVLTAIFLINLFELSVPVTLSTDYSVKDVLINGPFAVIAITVLACGVNIRLEATRRALAEHQQNRILGRLTGSVAHDFNNVLAVIYGNLELLTDTEDSRERAELLADIRTAAHSGSQLVRTLQALSQVRPSQTRLVTLGQQLGSTISALRRTVGKRAIEIEFEDRSAGARVRVDPALFESAIFHLCLNARDALPAGGLIRVNAARDGDDRVTVTVQDNGRGMGREVALQARDPFFSTKAGGEAAGLGLPMVDAFVKDLGGTLQIRSAPDQGTSVTLRLPRDQSEPAGSGGKEPGIPAGGKILVVEDEPALRKVVSQMLEALGYSVQVAGDAAQAQRILTTGPQFDLVLTDWLMPGEMDGLMLARWIRNKYPHMKILIATGYSDAVEDATQSAEFPVLFKPYSRAELKLRIDEARAPGTGSRSRAST